MDLKPSDLVMVDAVVREVCDNCVALSMDEVFGNSHIIVRPGTIHASIATTRDRIMEEICTVKMPFSARGAVEAIINKHLGASRKKTRDADLDKLHTHRDCNSPENREYFNFDR
jgi:hypothetical protein